MSKDNQLARPDDKTFLITVNGRQRQVESAEVRRHQVRVVQVGQRRARVGGASVEHGPRERLQRRGVRVGEAGRQRERVVDEADGVAVVAL